jgi:hypothetical protein
MERALEFAGYDVRHVWGEGTHNGDQALAVFPEAMKWLWRGWPGPVTAGHSQNTFLQAILPADGGWDRVGGDRTVGEGLSANAHGDILGMASDGRSLWTLLTGGGEFEAGPALTGVVRSLAQGPGDRLYVSDEVSGALFSLTGGQLSVVTPGLWPEQIAVSPDGRIYVTTNPTGPARVRGGLWLIASGMTPRRLDRELRDPSGIALSPDGLWLAVVERSAHGGYSYRVKPDGSVDARQRFYWLQVADEDEDSGARALAMDRDGRLYAATRMGVQVLDRNGRVRAILPLNGQAAVAIAFLWWVRFQPTLRRGRRPPSVPPHAPCHGGAACSVRDQVAPLERRIAPRRPSMTDHMRGKDQRANDHCGNGRNEDGAGCDVLGVANHGMVFLGRGVGQKLERRVEGLSCPNRARGQYDQTPFAARQARSNAGCHDQRSRCGVNPGIMLLPQHEPDAFPGVFETTKATGEGKGAFHCLT